MLNNDLASKQIPEMNHFENIINHVDAIIFSFDRNGIFTSSNGKVLELLGLKPMEVVGMSVFDVYANEPEILENCKKALKGQALRSTLAVGEMVLDTSFTPVFDKNGIVEQVAGVSFNVTGHIELENEINTQKERLNRIIKASNTGIWEWNIKENEVYYSPHWKAILGYADSELPNKFETWQENLHPDDKELMVKNVQDYLRNPQGNFEHKFRMKHKNGNYVWILNRSTVSLDKNGNPAFMSGSHLDISKQLEDAEELKKRERLFRIVFENSSLGTSLTSTDGTLKANRAFSQITGYSVEELQQKNWKEITHPEDIEKSEKFIQSLINNEQNHVRFKKRFIHKDGRYIWAELNSTLHKNEKGEPDFFITTISDISERVKAEKELNEVRENLEAEKALMDSLMENIPDTIYFKDKESRFIRVSASMVKRLGVNSLDEIIGKKDIEFHLEENAKKFVAEEKRIMETRTPQVNDIFHLKTKFGQDTWISTTKMPLIDRNGDVVGTFGFSKDVTEIKNSEEKHRAVFDSAKDAFVLVNSEGRITEVNASACKIYGYQYSEMINMPAINLVHPDRKQVFSNFLKSIEQTGSFNGENIDIRKDGTSFESDIYGTIVNYNNQQQILAVIRDISLRKQREEELNLKNRVYDTSVAANSISDTNGVISSVNKSFLKIWGYDSIDEVIGKPIPAFIKFEEEAAEILKGLTEKGEWQGIYTALKKDGSTFFARASASILQDINGNLIGYQSSVFDVTEAKEAEERIKTAQKELERSNQELEQFAYISSHDLQEPLRKIKSYSELLEFKYREQLDEKAGKYLDIITSGTERMQTLIDDLLTYSRISTKAKAFEPVSLNEILAEVTDILEIRINESNATINCENLPVINGDSRQMKQLFQNLISNALKFKSEQNPLINISVVEKDKLWQLQIEDNGIGFDMEFAERIFMAFHRLHSRSEYSGSGIGLAICKKIVQRHGGNLWAESKPGEGATFYFTFPKSVS